MRIKKVKGAAWGLNTLHYKTKPHILTANREEFVKRTPDGEVWHRQQRVVGRRRGGLGPQERGRWCDGVTFGAVGLRSLAGWWCCSRRGRWKAGPTVMVRIRLVPHGSGGTWVQMVLQYVFFFFWVWILWWVWFMLMKLC